jgi:hypothetical protein
MDSIMKIAENLPESCQETAADCNEFATNLPSRRLFRKQLTLPGFFCRQRTSAADVLEGEGKLSQFCGGDAVAASGINAFLEAEIDRLSAAVSSGFARGKVRKPPRPKEGKEKNTHGRCADC